MISYGNAGPYKMYRSLQEHQSGTITRIPRENRIQPRKPQYSKMVNDAEARRMATRAEQDLNSYQAKQGLGPQSDSGM
jgi:hypothetical protein